MTPASGDRKPIGTESGRFQAVLLEATSVSVSHTETADRFCRTCVYYHETRVRFLPGEASDLIPPACYFQGTVMPTGWCGGTGYQEDIP